MDMNSARELLLSETETEKQKGRIIVETLAREGDPLAKYAIATWYLHGSEGYKKDLAMAVSLLRQSAEQFVPEACFDLAVAIERQKIGGGRKEAFSWYVLGALLGDEDAAHGLARCFYWGIGTFRDRAAYDHLERALEMGLISQKSAPGL